LAARTEQRCKTALQLPSPPTHARTPDQRQPVRVWAHHNSWRCRLSVSVALTSRTRAHSRCQLARAGSSVHACTHAQPCGPASQTATRLVMVTSDPTMSSYVAITSATSVVHLHLLTLCGGTLLDLATWASLVIFHADRCVDTHRGRERSLVCGSDA
jgi:hypothetical protein